MKLLTLISVLFLTACSPKPEQVIRYKAPPVPEELLRPVEVVCADGDLAKDLGACVIAKVAGLDEANSKITAIGEILKDPALN